MKAIIININQKVEVFDRGNGQYFCPEMHCIYGDSELAVCPEQSGPVIKPYTDVEQSRCLLGLGTDPCTADMWSERNTEFPNRPDWNPPSFIPLFDKQAEMDEYDRFFVVNKKYVGRSVLPVWSLAALKELLPEEIQAEYRDDVHHQPVRYFLTMDSKYSYVYAHDLKDWQVSEGVPRWLTVARAGNWLDAAFKMVEWLKEKKHI